MSRKRVSITDIDECLRRQIGEQPGSACAKEMKALHSALYDSSTQKQRKYMSMYFIKGMTMDEIAAACGVAKSTVSRTIALGRRNILKSLDKAGLAKLIVLPQEEEV